MTAKDVVGGGDWRVEGLSKKEKGLMDIYNSMVIVKWNGI